MRYAAFANLLDNLDWELFCAVYDLHSAVGVTSDVISIYCAGHEL